MVCLHFLHFRTDLKGLRLVQAGFRRPLQNIRYIFLESNPIHNTADKNQTCCCWIIPLTSSLAFWIWKGVPCIRRGFSGALAYMPSWTMFILQPLWTARSLIVSPPRPVKMLSCKILDRYCKFPRHIRNFSEMMDILDISSLPGWKFEQNLCAAMNTRVYLNKINNVIIYLPITRPTLSWGMSMSTVSTWPICCIISGPGRCWCVIYYEHILFRLFHIRRQNRLF